VREYGALDEPSYRVATRRARNYWVRWKPARLHLQNTKLT
jgi:hypothetical protein